MVNASSRFGSTKAARKWAKCLDVVAPIALAIAIILVIAVVFFVFTGENSIPLPVKLFGVLVSVLQLVIAVQTYNLKSTVAALRADDNIINYVRVVVDLLERWDEVADSSDDNDKKKRKQKELIQEALKDAELFEGSAAEKLRKHFGISE